MGCWGLLASPVPRSGPALRSASAVCDAGAVRRALRQAGWAANATAASPPTPLPPVAAAVSTVCCRIDCFLAPPHPLQQEKKKKYEPPAPPPRVGKKQRRRAGGSSLGTKLPTVTPTAKCKLRLLKLERVKDWLLMEEEFVQNQEQLKPADERNEEERTKVG